MPKLHRTGADFAIPEKNTTTSERRSSGSGKSRSKVRIRYAALLIFPIRIPPTRRHSRNDQLLVGSLLWFFEPNDFVAIRRFIDAHRGKLDADDFELGGKFRVVAAAVGFSPET